MVQYAFSTGRVVPIEVMVGLDQAVSAADGLAVAAAPERRDEALIAEAAARGAPAIEMSRFDRCLSLRFRFQYSGWTE